MAEFVVTWLAPLAPLAVLAVLMDGLWKMMRGGSANRSKTLMRWRVGLQFLAVIVIMTGLYLVNL